MSESKEEFLVVYPGKYWQWDDQRPSVFDLTMTMYNLETGHRYFVQRGEKEISLKRIETSDGVKSRFSALIWLTLDTKWHQPKPIGISSTMINGEKIDLVETQLEDHRIDFSLDEKTHLPVRLAFFLRRAAKHKD